MDKKKYKYFNFIGFKFNFVNVFFIILFSVTSILIFKNINIITVDNEKKTFFTFKKTVKDFLNEKNIEFSDNDKISFKKDGTKFKISDDIKLSKNNKIAIHKAILVNVLDNNKEKKIYTTENLVSKILAESNIFFNDKDEIYPKLEETVKENDTLVLFRRTEEFDYKMETIPFSTEEIKDENLFEGTKKIIKNGNNGIKRLTYKVCFKNNEETSREKITEETIKEANNKVFSVGTKKKIIPKLVEKKQEDNIKLSEENKTKLNKNNNNPINLALFAKQRILTSRDGFRYRKVINCSATAYDASFRSTGKRPGSRGYGITASGMSAKYGVVAVDPKVIPLKSRLYVESPDKSWIYGLAIAGDTGGAIKGNKIDLCFDTENEALRFGRRNAVVYILDDE